MIGLDVHRANLKHRAGALCPWLRELETLETACGEGVPDHR